MQPTKLDVAFDNLAQAEENKKAVFAVAPEAADSFKTSIEGTARKLLASIEKSANGPYELEASDLAKLTKAVCELQTTFYPSSKGETSGAIIMTNQLSVFKGML